MGYWIGYAGLISLYHQCTQCISCQQNWLFVGCTPLHMAWSPRWTHHLTPFITEIQNSSPRERGYRNSPMEHVFFFTFLSLSLVLVGYASWNRVVHALYEHVCNDGKLCHLSLKVDSGTYLLTAFSGFRVIYHAVPHGNGLCLPFS